MSQSTAPITVRADQGTIDEIDALALAMDLSRNDIVNKALRQFIEANAWQAERIKTGITDTRSGRVHAAEEVFAEIAAKHGWSR
jgi:predicted transcriptional regulator